MSQARAARGPTDNPVARQEHFRRITFGPSYGETLAFVSLPAILCL